MTIKVGSKDVINILQITLLVVILGLLLWSKPWTDSNSSELRKITVTGNSSIDAEPDEYSFSPYFEKTGNDQEALKSELTNLVNNTVTELKKLGVDEKDIKLDVSSYDYWFVADGEDGSLNASIQIKVRDKDLTQKIQDYLLSTEAKGQLTPQASFSDTKQKELDAMAVDQAIDDAKDQASRQAEKLGGRIGKVLEFNQSQDSVFPIMYDAKAIAGDSAVSESNESLPVLSGQNEYNQSVIITYELK